MAGSLLEVLFAFNICFYICFYISSLSLEVIKIFQVNKSASHRFLLRCSKPENFVQFALGNCRKLTPEFLVEWEAPIISENAHFRKISPGNSILFDFHPGFFG